MYGDSGFGKTSLLAVASIRIYDWLGDTPDLIVIRRFLGTTPDSTNVGSLLDSVNKQLSYAINSRLGDNRLDGIPITRVSHSNPVTQL